MMTRYSEIFVALDFAVKYEASAVTIEMDGGNLTVSPQTALETFDALEVGEAFGLKAIYFETEENW